MRYGPYGDSRDAHAHVSSFEIESACNIPILFFER